jgi:hypothetical protein
MERERRRARSEYREQALRLFFSSVAEKNDLMGLVLCDPSGLLVASNLPTRVAEEVAAEAPFLAGQEGLLNALTRNEEYPLFVQEVQIAGQSLFLCIVGRLVMEPQSLVHAEGGVKRILGLN